MIREVSEELFESYCRHWDVSCEPISPSDTRTPDYRLALGGRTVFAEVKQINPNDEERRLMKQLDERDWAEAFGGAPGHRALLKMREAAKQLRLLAKGYAPAVVVLYNNVPLTTHHLDPYAIKTAMHGLEEIHLSVSADPHVRSHVVDSRFGRRRGVTPEHNTTVSAVAVLAACEDDSPCLSVYHNPHCAFPIDPEWLRNDKTRHYVLEEKVKRRFQEWLEV